MVRFSCRVANYCVYQLSLTESGLLHFSGMHNRFVASHDISSNPLPFQEGACLVFSAECSGSGGEAVYQVELRFATDRQLVGGAGDIHCNCSCPVHQRGGGRCATVLCDSFALCSLWFAPN